MKNFHINTQGEARSDSQEHHWFTAGTQVLFDMIDGQLHSRIRIPIQFA